MDGLRQYVIRVITAALICGVITSLCGESAGKSFIRMLCGLFLTITALSPIVKLDLGALIDYEAAYSIEAEQFSSAGEKMARDAAETIIKQQTEAYILDKAAALGVDVSVDVRVNHNTPEEVAICGSVSPYTRKRLESILESDLGITKEHQIWTG